MGGWNRGLPKIPGSGRRTGTPNKVNASLLEKVQERVQAEQGVVDYDPLIELAVIANDATIDVALRTRAHSEIAKYFHPQKRSVEVSSSEDRPMEVRLALADRLLLALEKAAR